ncbi:hypothetical protein PTKIN_Ptkin12aG0011300 [Pterospermum kingtungense]
MKKAELVFIPWPAMGHLVPAVGLAKRMVDLNPHLSITLIIINSPYDPKVNPYIDSLTANTTFTNTRIKFIVLPTPETDKNVPSLEFMSSVAQSLIPLVKEAVTNIVQFSTSVLDSPRLAGIVVDMFFLPLLDLADDFGVPKYVFYASPASFLGFQFYMQALYDEQNVDVVELKDSDTEFTIPYYMNPVSITFFPGLVLRHETSTMFHDMARGFREVNGILVNTFVELESHALNSFSNGRLPPVYPVGPILNLESATGVRENSNTILEWLDEQPPASVVFLCFGSRGSFGVDQVREIACALEQSGHRFLWSLRQPPSPTKGCALSSPTDYDNVENVLPKGFLDRTAMIGKIIGWAPQVAILGHPAIGGFMSHCGWNSILESIWFGVPIATWPLHAEQQLNAFELVTGLGLAVEIKMDNRRDKMKKDEVEIVKTEKIEKGIKHLMEQDNDVRRRVKEMSEKSRKTLIKGGSSRSMLCCFINHVMDNMP